MALAYYVCIEIKARGIAMKHLMVLMIFASFFSFSAFAEETTTECVMMREMNERTNPKANMSNIKQKLKKPKVNGVTAQ